MTPGGIRMGAPALTTRWVVSRMPLWDATISLVFTLYAPPPPRVFSGFTEEDFEKVAIFFDRAVGITEAITKKTGTKLADFKKALAHGPQDFPDLVALGNEIRDFSRTFPTIGF